MTFDEILAPLVSREGAISAAFLDPHGEPIAVVGDRGSLQALGAYQSVWMGELGKIAEEGGLGSIGEVSFEFEARSVLAAPVREGYFILLVLPKGATASVARARLEEARERLVREIS